MRRRRPGRVPVHSVLGSVLICWIHWPGWSSNWTRGCRGSRVEERQMDCGPQTRGGGWDLGGRMGREVAVRGGLRHEAIFLSSPTNTFSCDHEHVYELYDCEHFKLHT